MLGKLLFKLDLCPKKSFPNPLVLAKQARTNVEGARDIVCELGALESHAESEKILAADWRGAPT